MNADTSGTEPAGTTSIAGLPSFLAARLDEDEAILKLAALYAPHFPDCDTMGGPDYPSGGCNCGLPDRWQRELEAKRRILARYERFRGGRNGRGSLLDRVAAPPIATAMEPALRDLAAVWSDHPDYDPAWGNG